MNWQIEKKAPERERERELNFTVVKFEINTIFSV